MWGPMGRGVNSPEFLVQRGRIEGNPKYSQFRRPKVYTAGWTGQLLDDEFKEGLITRLCGCLPGSLTDRLACFFFFFLICQWPCLSTSYQKVASTSLVDPGINFFHRTGFSWCWARTSRNFWKPHLSSVYW